MKKMTQENGSKLLQHAISLHHRLARHLNRTIFMFVMKLKETETRSS